MSEEIAEGPRVVIAEDDPTVRLILAGVLTSEGFQVAEAANGLEALERVRETRPALVILDVEMPGANGFEVCRAIRGESGQDGPPILILTGLEQEKAVQLAFDAGATDFANKPITPALLLHRVRFLLRNAAAVGQLRNSEQALEQAQRIARLGSWSWHLPTGVTSYSRPAQALLGLAPEDGLWIGEYLDRVAAGERQGVEDALTVAREGGAAADVRHQLLLPDGSLRHAHTRAELESNPEGRPVYLHGTLQDVTARVEAEEHIRRLALFDQLTGLPNRSQFTDHLKFLLGTAARHDQCVAVLRIDLNRFGRINETRDYETGDALLIAVGHRLRNLLRVTDLVARDRGIDEPMLAREGSDDFLLALGALDRAEQAAIVASRLLDAFREPFQCGTETYTLSASIGISIFPADGAADEELLRHSAGALRQARESGGNAFAFFDRALGERVAARRELEDKVRKAVEREEFTLYYQPQVDTDGRLVGAEALMRWFLPDGTEVSPAVVIPVMEETGLIHRLVEWTLRTGLAQMAVWDGEGRVLPSLAVNLSGRQLGIAGIVEHLAAMVRESGIAAGRVTLEITEGTLVDHPDAVALLRDFRAQGFRISVDDFGTGYSALSYLPKFPIDSLKIDRSFIRDLPGDMGQAAIVRAIVSLALELGIEPVAEGVEEEAQRQFLIKAGCPTLQGYLFGKAMAPEALGAMLDEQAVPACR